MLSHPRIKSCYAVSVVEPDLVFLMSEHAEHVFQGEAYAALVPHLDGRRSMGEAVALAAGRAPLPNLFAALAQLQSKQVLANGESLADSAAAAFWDTTGGDPASLAAGVAVEGIDEDAAALARALARVGIAVPGEAALHLLAVGDYLEPRLEQVNRAALAEGRSWALARLRGTVAWVGPVFRPGQTGCWLCLAHRLRVNRQVEYYLHTREGRPLHSEPRAWLPSSVGAAAAWAAVALARGLSERTLEDRVLTLDLVDRRLDEHVLVRRPQCAACGSPTAREPPVRLEPRPRPRAAHGRERTAHAAETFEKYKHHVSPITGVVTALVPREPDEPRTHNYVAGHYFPVTSEGLSGLRVNLVARSGGKGRTEAQARTSALCEALERYSGIAWGDEPRVTASAAALGAEAVPIAQLALFSPRQYAERERERGASELHDVPPPLPDDAEISWSPAWSLTDGRVRYLPTAYCYYGFRDPGRYFTRCDSNGNAAGNSLEEAILYGMLELVERDSVALWWYNRARRPALDARSFGLPYWDEMERHYDRELDRDLHALDLTADLGIPTFAVVSRRRARPVEDVIVGFAAHLDPAVALLRALEEANQYLPSVRLQDEDGATIYRLYSEETVRWWKHATFENQPYLVPHPDRPVRRADDFPRLASDDVRRDVESCVAAAARAGLEVIVLDQTRPDVGLPVVKVVVPGLRHFWRRLAPGRLYDVPVTLGWIDRPLAEEEMNPISCFV